MMTLWKAAAATKASAHRRGNREKREISQVIGQRGRPRALSRNVAVGVTTGASARPAGP